MPTYTEDGPAIIEHNGVKLKEFPICTKKFLGKHIVYCGGGYFRLCPYSLMKKWTAQKDYVLSYIHPRDLDAGQPMIKELDWKRKFKSYIGLRHAEKKLKQFLTDFPFCDILEADRKMNWENSPLINM